MKDFFFLLRLDILRIKNWFRNSTATKILVILGFFVVIAIVIVFEFLLANIFFRLTSTQQEFGMAVAQYSINAAMLVLYILATASSLAASSSLLYGSNFLRFLHTTPVSTVKLFISRTLSSMFSSLWLLISLLLPILIAFGLNFSQGADFILRSLFVITLLAISSQATGSIFTLLLAKVIGKISRKIFAVIFLLVITSSFGLLRFLFPPKFYRLYNAPDWPTFQSQLGQLPLFSNKLPTNWLAETITQSWSWGSFAALIGTTLLVIIAIQLGKNLYFNSWRKVQEGNQLAGKDMPIHTKILNFPITKSSRSTLIVNEFLSVIRSPSELSYIAFLTSLSIMLLFLMRNISALEKSAPTFIPVVQSLAFAGLSYLFMTLSARLVYPLMAKEKRTSWFLFSLPMPREEILMAKFAFALLISLPSAIIGLLASILIGFPVDKTIFFTSLLLITAGFVSLIQLFFGIIAPNFAESDNLEAASTSGSGLASVVFSLSFILLSTTLFYFVNLGYISGIYVIAVILAISILLLVPLLLVSRHSIHSYNL